MRNGCTPKHSETVGEEVASISGGGASTDAEMVAPGELPPRGVERGERSGEHGGVEVRESFASVTSIVPVEASTPYRGSHFRLQKLPASVWIRR